MTGFLQDLRQALRMLRRSPGFSAAVVVTLALGIGANAALFMVLDAVVFQRLPVGAPDELVLLSPLDARGHWGGGFDQATFEMLRDGGRPVADLFAFDSSPLGVETDGQAEILWGATVSGSYFGTLRVGAALGRTFREDDDRPSAAPVAVVSDAYWMRRFGRESSVLGKTANVKNLSFRIVGVAAPGFSGIEPGQPCDVWVPMSAWTAVRLKDHDRVGVMGRLRPGVSAEAARAALTGIYRDALFASAGSAPSSSRSSEIRETSIVLRPGGRGTEGLREELSRRLSILLGAAGLLLLIACANVANLQLARAKSRQKEIAVRLALGAGTGRLARQLLTESLVLALAGGAAGVAAAAWSSAALVHAVGGQRLPVSPATGWRVLLFSAAVTLVAAAVFGVAPALKAAARDPSPDLKGAAFERAGSSRRRLPFADALVISQFALSLSLVAGAGLLARSLASLHAVDPGFRSDGVLLFWLYPTLSGVDGPAEKDLYRAVEDRLSEVPGVRSASDFRFGFLAGRWERQAFAEGGAGGRESRPVFFDAVGPGFFETMGIPVRIGRGVSRQDTPGSAKVVVLNQSAANRLFGDASPLGRTIGFETPPGGSAGTAGAPEEMEVVGVVSDTRSFSLRGGDGTGKPAVVYGPVSQAPESLLGQMNFAVRTDGDPRALLPAVTRAAASAAPGVPVTRVRTLEEQVGQSLAQERSLARLLSFFGALALVLAGVGLHGVMAHSVARRTREIGVRMALGATRRLVLGDVLRRSLVLTLAGFLLGAALLPAVARVIAGLLYEVSPADPATLLAAASLLAAVSLAAACVPARRATRVDPVEALRSE
jgi:predicted permease